MFRLIKMKIRKNTSHNSLAAKLMSRIKFNNDSFIISIEIPDSLSEYCIHKGSITVNGVSLTIASIEENLIDIWIIPHTLSHTTFGSINENDYVKRGEIIAKLPKKIEYRFMARVRHLHLQIVQ